MLQLGKRKPYVIVGYVDGKQRRKVREGNAKKCNQLTLGALKHKGGCIIMSIIIPYPLCETLWKVSQNFPDRVGRAWRGRAQRESYERCAVANEESLLHIDLEPKSQRGSSLDSIASPTRYAEIPHHRKPVLLPFLALSLI